MYFIPVMRDKIVLNIKVAKYNHLPPLLHAPLVSLVTVCTCTVIADFSICWTFHLFCSYLYLYLTTFLLKNYMLVYSGISCFNFWTIIISKCLAVHVGRLLWNTWKEETLFDSTCKLKLLIRTWLGGSMPLNVLSMYFRCYNLA
jgi:hypothetical protein